MSKSFYIGNKALKHLYEEILKYKPCEINKTRSNSSKKTTTKIATFKKDNKTEEVKKTLNQINSVLKRGPNLAKIQKDIFFFLSNRGLEKLTEMIKDDDVEIRKKSFLCLVNLLDKNDELINLYCKKYKFNPVGNVICINWLPKVFDEKVYLNLEILQDIQESSVNFNQSTKYWKWPNNPKFTDTIVPDPNKYLLGFVHKENDIFMCSEPMKTKDKKIKEITKYEKEVLSILEKRN